MAAEISVYPCALCVLCGEHNVLFKVHGGGYGISGSRRGTLRCERQTLNETLEW